MKGAAFTAACMTEGQKNPAIDMLMYYDARPTGMNGLFDLYTLEPLKGYYPFLIYSKLNALSNEAQCVTDDGCIYCTAAANGDKAGIMLTYYSENDDVLNKRVDIEVDGLDMTGATVYVTDEEFTMTPVPTRCFADGKLTLYLKRNSVVYIEK